MKPLFILFLVPHCDRTKEYNPEEELRQTANELVSKVDDPKLQNTEVSCWGLMFTRELSNYFRAHAIPLNISISSSFLICYIFWLSSVISVWNETSSMLVPTCPISICQCCLAVISFFPPPLSCSSCDSLGRLARAVWQWRTEQTNSSLIKLRPRRLRIGPPTSTRYESLLTEGGRLQLGSPPFHSISHVSLWLTPISDGE